MPSLFLRSALCSHVASGHISVFEPKRPCWNRTRQSIWCDAAGCMSEIWGCRLGGEQGGNSTNQHKKAAELFRSCASRLGRCWAVIWTFYNSTKRMLSADSVCVGECYVTWKPRDCILPVAFIWNPFPSFPFATFSLHCEITSAAVQKQYE